MSDTDEFARLFEASQQARRVEKGQTIDGTIVAIGPEVAFVDVGGKGEAIISIDELKDPDGALEVAVGERIQAVVVSTSGGLTLSRRLARRAANDQQLEEAFRSGLAVEGKVESIVKGGFQVRIARQRAFCPISQIDIVRNTVPEDHINRVYPFRVLEYTDGGRKFVVSRRALLEEEQRAHAAELRRSLVVGAVMTGRVTSVRDFGAFVDLGAGVQGLLHVSEMAWSRVSDASQVVSPGDEVSVKILRIDEEKQQIALGMRQLRADPWSTVAATYEIGQVRPGRVTRIADFGAFVELEPGIEALAHVSTFPPTGRRDGWTRSVEVGTTSDFEILSIDLDKKRIGVALLPEGSARAGASQAIVAGARVQGTVERHEPYGVFVFLAPGRTGLMPVAEAGVPEAEIARTFPVGSHVDVEVLDVDPASRRIRLSRKAILDAKEAENLREYTERSEGAGSAAFGSFADKLRGALNRKS